MDIDNIIKARKTQKVLPNQPWPDATGDLQLKATLEELLDLAAHAPYHYPCHRQYIAEKELNSCMPFRFYALDRTKCRATSQYIDEAGIEAGKVKNMLDGADALLIVTWLPEPSELNQAGSKKEVSFAGNLTNMEHISAASAAIQNVLLGATARGIPNYWSTGGPLRSQALRDYLSVPMDEIIAGTVFLFPESAPESGVKILPGGMRQQGKEKNTWATWIS